MFVMGLAGPALLTNSLLELRPLSRGETVRHAWNGVGTHLSRALQRIADEETTSTNREKA
jgi:hypothetical protein